MDTLKEVLNNVNATLPIGESKIRKEGRVTIPLNVRKELGLTEKTVMNLHLVASAYDDQGPYIVMYPSRKNAEADAPDPA